MKLLSILLLTISLNPLFSESQFRVSKENMSVIENISGNASLSVMITESMLNQNNKILESNNTGLSNPLIASITDAINNRSIDSVNRNLLIKTICVKCYEDEYNSQKLKAQEISRIKEEKIKQVNDSIYKLKYAKYELEIKQKEEEIFKTRDTTSMPLSGYDFLKANIEATRRTNFNRYTTPFIGLDVNFSAPSLEGFLQDHILLNNSKTSVNKNQFIQLYEPKFKASDNKDYIKITYTLTEKKGVTGYGGIDNVSLINSVDIVGSKSYIINLFIDFWDTKFKLESMKQGEIIVRRFLNDKIILSAIDKQTFKIQIVSNEQLHINYEDAYGIHKPINNVK